MSRETTNQGYIDAQNYASDPDNVDTPDRDYQEYGRGIDSFGLSSAGDVLSIAAIITADTINNRIGINEPTPNRALHVKSSQQTVAVFESTNVNAGGISFMDATTTDDGRVVIQADGNSCLVKTNSAEVIRFQDDGNVAAGSDNTQTLGTATNRWSEVFAGNGTINTSDQREKTEVAIDSKVLDAVDSINIKGFKWNDAIKKKGEENARVHFGVFAQEVKAAFEAQGLSAEDYGVLCYDEWEETSKTVEVSPAEYDLDGNVVIEAQFAEKVTPAGNRYGVRYDELYALKIACLERKLQA